jgi:hypothetical protein
LQGAAATINRWRPLILFECCKNGSTFYGSDLTLLVSWLQRQGYSVFTVHGIPVNDTNSNSIFSAGLCWEFVAGPRDNAIALQTLLCDSWTGVMRGHDDQLSS